MEFQMKKIVSLLLAVVMLLGVMLSLTSCEEAPADAGAQISVYLGNEFYDLDPTDYYVDSNAEQVMSMLFEPLFRINEDGELEKALAKSYKVDVVDREIVIKLRESYWSTDDRVIAADFVYAWREALLSPNNANPAAALLYDIENAVAVKSGDVKPTELGVEASDTYELTIKYREGADYNRLLNNLASIATSPLRQGNVFNIESYWSKEASTIATNGAFKLNYINHATGELTLERNLGYHQSPTAVDYDNKVVPNRLLSFFIDGEERTISYNDIEEKTVFFMSDAPLSDRADVKDEAIVSDTLSVYSYVFNTTKAPFNNAKVRRALLLAIDREAVVEAITFGKAANGLLNEAVAKGVYGESVSDRIDNSDYESNLEEAKELMAEAKAEIEASGIKFNSVRKFTLTVNNDEESIAIANLVKQFWSQLQFVVTVKPVDYIFSSIDKDTEIIDSEIQKLVKDSSVGIRDFDVIGIDFQLYSTDALVSLASFTSNMNGCGADFANDSYRGTLSGWVNSDYDSYISAAYNARSEEKRAEYLAKAEEILLEEAPIAPIVFNQSFAFVSGDLTGIEVDGFGHFILNGATQANYHDYLPKEEVEDEEGDSEEEGSEDEE